MIQQDILRPEAEQEELEAVSDRTESSLRSVIESLTRLAQRKFLIAKVTAIGFVIGLVVCFSWPVHYLATARIMPPQQTQSTTTFLNSQGMGSLAEAAGGGLGLKDPNAIYIGLLKSRLIADTIIERFDLMRVYRSRDMTAARKKLEKNTEVQSEKSTLISIAVTDPDRRRAASIANAYTDQLRLLTKTISVTEASKRRLFFEEQLKAAKESVIEAEATLQQIQQTRGLVHLDAQAGVIVGSLANVRLQISAKQVELQALRSYSTDKNPDVQLVERELSTLQGQAAQLEQHSGSSEFSNLGLKDVPSAGLDYLRAQRELQYRQAFFDLLLKQYDAASLDEAKDGAVIQVVEPAIDPDRKNSPRRLIILLVSTGLGLAAGCLFAWFLPRIELELSDPLCAQAIRNLKYVLTGKNALEVAS